MFTLTTAPAAVPHPIVAGFERFHATATEESKQVDGGLLLLNELNCVACHAAPAGWRERLPGRGKVSLAGVGGRLSAEQLAQFVADPAKLKPGTTMPRVATDAKDVAAIAGYLASLKPGQTPKRFPAGDAKHGKQLFESVGCAACHAPEGVVTTYASVPLGLAAHMDRNALAAFLRDPLHTRPAGRMPAFELSDKEAADLAAYVSGVGRVSDPPSKPDAPTPKGRVEDPPYAGGRQAFAARNCMACHETGESFGQVARPAKPLVQLQAGRGCLAPQGGASVPAFSLSDAQTRALAAALRMIQSSAAAPTLSAEQRVAAKFEQLNCYACHEWRGRGGAEPARAKFFTATDAAVESLGEIGHLPPKLDAAGRKLTEAWLAKLLWGHSGGVRPYMTARMPRFGEAAAGDLVGMLSEACRPEKPEEIDVSGSKGHQRFATGRTFLGTGTGGLGCVACHGLKQREPAGVRAINLTHTAQRLRPEYFKALLLEPQKLQPGTIMPPLFAGRKNADKEIESIWTYFKELDQSNVLPEGLSMAGSFELKPQEEGRPIVFRTFLEGAGTQAIAVGYPAGVHVAFDAYEVRWALAWRGKFLDALTNWEDRAMKPVKPLGDAVRALPTHQSFAQLSDPADAWPAKFGAYAGYTFKGYRLAEDGVPTFRYHLNGVEVEDTLRPASDGKSLRRTVTLRRVGGADERPWYFRGIGQGVSPQPVRWQNGVATVEEEISW